MGSGEPRLKRRKGDVDSRRFGKNLKKRRDGGRSFGGANFLLLSKKTGEEPVSQRSFIGRRKEETWAFRSPGAGLEVEWGLGYCVRGGRRGGGEVGPLLGNSGVREAGGAPVRRKASSVRKIQVYRIGKGRGWVQDRWEGRQNGMGPRGAAWYRGRLRESVSREEQSVLAGCDNLRRLGGERGERGEETSINGKAGEDNSLSGRGLGRRKCSVLGGSDGALPLGGRRGSGNLLIV